MFELFVLIPLEDFDFSGLLDYRRLSESEPDSENESEPDTQYVAIKVAPQTLNEVPYGIINEKSWGALTFYIWIERRWRTLPVSEITDDLSHYSLIETIELDDPTDLRVEYDTHWDCYCKTEDVCGCGCDPLHDGW